MTDTGDRWAGLRAALEKATPGPWDRKNRVCTGHVHDEGGAFLASCEKDQDAAYIAAANPSEVRALLAERDALAAQAEEDAEAIERLGQFYADAGGEEALKAAHLTAIGEWNKAVAERDEARAERDLEREGRLKAQERCRKLEAACDRASRSYTQFREGSVLCDCGRPVPRCRATHEELAEARAEVERIRAELERLKEPKAHAWKNVRLSDGRLVARCIRCEHTTELDRVRVEKGCYGDE